ncbi:MAG: hypothetical protein ACRC7B_03015, partial [Metamycoplasmataceae bacterium]
MINNLKKIALGIMSAGGILVPLAVVASCGSSTSDEDFKITTKADPTVILADIEGDSYKSLRTLQKLFGGITQNDLNNITVTKDNISGNIYVITLKANDGYTIGGQSTLKSAEFTLSVELDIKARALAAHAIKAEDVDNDAFKSYATLQKLFEFDRTVITEELLNKAVVVTMTPMTGDQPRIVTLTANKGYAIGDMPSLNSSQFVISTNYVIEKTAIVPTDIKPSDIVGDKFKDFNVISKLFTGSSFNEGILENLDITLIPIVEGETYQIKLTPLNGFYINDGLDGITSDTFTLSIDLNITAKTLNPYEIKAADVNNDAFGSYATLQKLFEFNPTIVTEELLNKAVVVTMTPMTGNEPRFVTLAANSGYTIGNMLSLNSNN